MSRQDQFNFALSAFVQSGLTIAAQRITASWIHTCLNIATEVVTDQETISMTGPPTAGTFTLTFQGQTTTALQWNAAAEAIQAAIAALSNVGIGNVECTGGPLPGIAVVVNWIGALFGGQPVMTHTDTLTGGSASIAHTTTGTWIALHAKRTAKASQILNNPSGITPQMIMAVADNVTVQADFPPASYSPRTQSVTAATNATPISVTSTAHGLSTGAVVKITGAAGNTAANGQWTITVVDVNTYTLNGSVGNGVFSGTAQAEPVSVIDGDIDFATSSVFNAFL